MTDVLTILYTGMSHFDSQLYSTMQKFKGHCNDISVLNKNKASIWSIAIVNYISTESLWNALFGKNYFV